MAIGSNGGNTASMSKPVVDPEYERYLKYGIHIPVEKYCDNKKCFDYNQKKHINKNFCDICGEELGERKGDLWVTINTNMYDEKLNHNMDMDAAEKYPSPMEDEVIPTRISIKQLVRLLKEYEPEVFLDDI